MIRCGFGLALKWFYILNKSNTDFCSIYNKNSFVSNFCLPWKGEYWKNKNAIVYITQHLSLSFSLSKLHTFWLSFVIDTLKKIYGGMPINLFTPTRDKQGVIRMINRQDKGQVSFKNKDLVSPECAFFFFLFFLAHNNQLQLLSKMKNWENWNGTTINSTAYISHSTKHHHQVLCRIRNIYCTLPSIAHSYGNWPSTFGLTLPPGRNPVSFNIIWALTQNDSHFFPQLSDILLSDIFLWCLPPLFWNINSQGKRISCQHGND